VSLTCSCTAQQSSTRLWAGNPGSFQYWGSTDCCLQSLHTVEATLRWVMNCPQQNH
jgi:hypothetical protein